MIKRNLDASGRLSDKDIVALIDQHDCKKYTENELYFKGQNPTIGGYNTKDDLNDAAYIANSATREDIAPNNKIPVPYGRKIALTTKNYMFAKDVSYTAEDKEYVSRLSDVQFMNNNNRKVNDIGLDLIVHGVSYKLFYLKNLAGKNVPYYTVIDQNQMIPVYSYDIEPALICCIRHYKQEREDKKEAHLAEIYYRDAMVRAEVQGKDLTNQNATSYEWGRVPVVVYGDEYAMGVFDAVKKLIDGIDIIISADLNEIQRFELLYLVLVGDKMPSDPVERLQVLKSRIFELTKDASLSYLERHIDGAFIMALLDRLEKLTHKMSGVPDFESPEFSALSGIALLYKLMGFENIAMQYESAFKAGELESIDLINVMMEGATDKFAFWEANRNKQVTIKMFRNLPEDTAARLAEANLMKTLGLSMETILDYIPTIANTEQELKRMAEEKEKNFELFQSMQIPAEEPAKTEEDDAAVQ